MKEYIVSFVSYIADSHDHVYIMAENKMEALKIGKSMLNTHKLVPDFLNKYGRFNVHEVKN